jgi:ubiquinone/menaquinone biosynthesis C-methylase UbiE
MAEYYQQRASYYDQVYDVPERRDDVRRLQQLIPTLLAGRDVLEVAAGTGYWTQYVAAEAASVCARRPLPFWLACVAGWRRDPPW